MTTSSPVSRRDHEAFQRTLGLALWTQAQREPFAFPDIREAFGSAYSGKPAAVDKKWSRDKRGLAALGAPLELVSADHYQVREDSQPRRLHPSPADAAILQAFVRELPISSSEPAGARLELALRKLLLAGAPIRDALWDRHLTGARAGAAPAPRDGGEFRPLTTVEWRVRVGAVLHELLLEAGPAGLSSSDALVLSGARDADDLDAVVAHLLATDVPLPPPCDALGLERSGGRISAYLPTRRARRIALVHSEVRALELAAASRSSGPAAARLGELWQALTRVAEPAF